MVGNREREKGKDEKEYGGMGRERGWQGKKKDGKGRDGKGRKGAERERGYGREGREDSTWISVQGPPSS